MNDPIQALEIRTPEGAVFSLPLAGPVARFLAWLIDLAVVTAGVAILGRIAAALQPVAPDSAAALNLLMFFAASIGYGMALEWRWRGETVGKRVLRLRVVDRGGLRLSPGQVVLRNLLRAVDQLPLLYLVGGAAMWRTRHAQRLGDLAANTVVVRAAAVRLPPIDRLAPARFNSLRDHPHLEARLRRTVPPAAAALALRALLRRDELDDAARVELFHDIAAAFRAAARLPPELVRDLPDEQLVRNAVDSLYRAPADRAAVDPSRSNGPSGA